MKEVRFTDDSRYLLINPLHSNVFVNRGKVSFVCSTTWCAVLVQQEGY